ncbi:uncharacterized protein UV8b_06265 [Ustilaginoidea virens]|uniref:Uncharacterized protein n=1 Tax=Ustilaginoidea virens TaxID=1159556 RepID=A0A063BXE1_USTVR|nr:uncharacterized protein UV8b_06265 [Ustilaginoidea virens]QUC22024.1 hypothetical protein UV8b_06265 [Ustilaginoidea virens]GAO20134.1 hypothetical protein UVI_02023010 [Ustilaginoidea virens]
MARLVPLQEDFPFDIISHDVPVTPFREYPTAVVDESRGLRLSVKQYIPRDDKHRTNEALRTEPITIIAAGALGIAKESYEPLFEELLRCAQSSGVLIRSIWMADMFNVGQSALLNQDNLGCDPAWIDHSRDLWSLISRFSDLMVKPIVGLGHSFGCNQLLCLSCWHPSLFHSFAFVEPGIDARYGRGITIPWALQALRQRDSFPTRAEAEDAVVKLNNAASWDPRALSRLKHYSVRQARDKDGARSVWRPVTPKHQIAALVSRFNPGRVGLGPNGTKGVTMAEREVVPDSDPLAFNIGPFYRHELRLAWNMLPSMRPCVLYVNGAKSPFFGHPATREERLRRTGTGVGGNGGVKLGAVRQVVIEGGEHTMVFDESLKTVAAHVADWLADECRRWTEGPKRRRELWLRDAKDKGSVGSDFLAALDAEMKRMKSRAGKL